MNKKSFTFLKKFKKAVWWGSVVYGLVKVYKYSIDRYSTFGISTFKIDKIFVSILKDFTFNEYSVKVCKNAFACLLIVHDTLILSRHEQVSLMRLRFERYLSHHQAIEMIMFGTFMWNMQIYAKYADLDGNNRTHRPGWEEVVQCN